MSGEMMTKEAKGLKSTSNNEAGILRRIVSAPEFSVFIPLLLLIVLTGVIKPIFFANSNVMSVLRALAFYAIIAIGETLVLLVAEVDISVGQIAGLGAIISTWFMTKGGVDPLTALLIAIVLCGILGLINGVLVSYVKLSAFITTIGMLYIAKGFKFIISKGYPIYPLPESINKFGTAEPLGTSWALIIAVILLIIFDFVLRKTAYGRKLYAVGDNKEVARLAGINVARIKISAFVISAMLACISGYLLAAQIHTGQAGIGDGWELQAVAAVAVGGISLAGGAGTIFGAALGVVFIAVLNNSLVLLKIDANVQTVLIGVVMLAAVIADVIKRSRKVKS